MSQKCLFKCSGVEKLFSFPKNNDTKQKWCEILKLDKASTYAKLCQRHFNPKDIGQKRISPNGLPLPNGK